MAEDMSTSELVYACEEMSAMLGRHPSNGFYMVNAGCVDNFRECLDNYRKSRLARRMFSPWECQNCGSQTKAGEMPSPSWRWNGLSWEHKCEGVGSHANYAEAKELEAVDGKH